MGLKSDRVAVELNRQIVPRDQWDKTSLSEGDRLEIVHFVGGGTVAPPSRWQFWPIPLRKLAANKKRRS
jgi:hypothetical protein